MSVIITLEADIKKGLKNTFLTMLKELLPETRIYKGFLNINIHTQKDTNHILFFEEWESIEDYEDYLHWRTETGIMDKLGDAFEMSPIIRYYNTENI
jgi:quinol monooxygenase YgiN